MRKNLMVIALTGTLALVGCADKTVVTDTTLPVVNLEVAPNTLPSSGGPVLLSGVANDNVGVSSVTVTRNDGSVLCTPNLASNGTFSCSATVPANTTSNPVIYTYTAKAVDAANNSRSAAVTVTVSPPPVPVVSEGNSSLVTTSPVSGAAVTSNTVQLVYSYSDLTDLKCGIQGQTLLAPTNPGSTAGACNIDLSGVPNGPVTLVIQGTASSGQVLTTNVSINKNVATTPQATEVAFGPEMMPDAAGYIDYALYRKGGTRMIDQLNLPPSAQPIPGSGDLRYVKGNIELTFHAPAGANRVEAWLHGTIDGSKLGAFKYLYDGAPGGKITFDTTGLNGMQSRIVYLVVRYYSAGSNQVKSYPFVVDNTGPQASDPDFEAAPEPGSRVVRDFGNPNNNWAKGKVQIYTSNANLSDLVYNPASLQDLPSGVEYINYYFVPLGKLGRITTIQGQQRVLDIIKEAAFNTGAVEYASDRFATRDYRAEVDSSDGSKDGRYAIFSITVDHMGNESASTTYQNLGFDNIGPSGGLAVGP